MRLIDADTLKTAFPCGERVTTECVRGTISAMPTIDAIPVEWLLKWIKTLQEGAYVRDIIHDWRKEQEAR